MHTLVRRNMHTTSVVSSRGSTTYTHTTYIHDVLILASSTHSTGGGIPVAD